MFEDTLYVLAIFIEIIALIAPLTTPQISPITSAHIFATLDAFFIKLKEDFAPSAFLVAFAWKSSSGATVTAIPTISNIIPIKTTIINITIDKIKLNRAMPLLETNDNSPGYINVKKNA